MNNRPALPLWPLVAAFGAMPLLWLAGGFYFAWPVLGLVLAVLLVARGGRIPLPAGAGLWLLFLALVTLSLSQLGGAGELVVAGLRLAFYLTAFLVGVYVYTALREGRSWEQV